MRSIAVDFTKSYIGTVARQGEHNKTELVFTLPDDFAGADYINAEFDLADKSKVVMDSLEPPADNTLTVPVVQTVTACRGSLGIQLVAYAVDGAEIVEIAKSPIVKGYIDRSIEATEPADKSASFIERLQAWLQDARDKLAALWELRHGHGNKATLDEIYSAALETPEPEVTVGGMADPYRDQLSFRGQYLRMINDGGVIQGAEEVTVNGRKYLRLKIFYDPAVETYDIIEIGQNARPRFIDIPIASAQDSTIVDGGVTLNGTEISLGLDSVEQEIIGIQENVASNTAARHSHSNQQLLNQIGVATMISGTMPMAISYNNIPMDGWSTVFTNGANVSDILYANVRLVCSTPLESLSINALSNPISIRVPEYLIEFTTGATAPTVTLPSSIIWANELTVEPNKHYQISILNNIALWCAVDVEVEE